MNPESEIVGAPIEKSFEIKADGAEMDENGRLCGNAAVMGIMDRGQDVIFPGAFKKVLKAFLTDGVVFVGHRWSGLPVAMPMKAVEQGQNLYTEAQFHSTDSAQEARTICRERLAAKKSVGLSVGFGVDYETGRMWFENGKLMAKYIEDSRDDLHLFDLKGIKECKGYCRAIFEAKELYEYSIAPIPMQRLAMATEAKQFALPQDIDFSTMTERQFEALLRDLGASQKIATAITLHGIKAALQRDAGNEEPDTAAAAVDAETLRLAAQKRILAMRADLIGAGVSIP